MLLKHLYIPMVGVLLLISQSMFHDTLALDMDVKCAVYQNSDDMEGDDVDVRIYVLGLKPNSEYTALVIPDHSPPSSLTMQTDYEGIFWSVVKIPNGDNNLSFKVEVYEGNNTDGSVIASGDDDAPCYGIELNN